MTTSATPVTDWRLVARSQVATDTRLYLARRLRILRATLQELIAVATNRAEVRRRSQRRVDDANGAWHCLRHDSSRSCRRRKWTC